VDQGTLEAIKTLDILKLFAHVTGEERKGAVPNLQTAMCARGGVGTAILFAKAGGADHAQVLHYANSGDVPAGGKNRVVGYSSLLFVKKGAPAS
jgi:AmmeMemoRadiSam system protein B